MSASHINLSGATTGGVYALGNFDGVHRGHQIIIERTIEIARQLGMPAKVLTLEPHPRQLFNPAGAPFRLTPSSVKQRLLRHYGIEDIAVLPFTEQIAQLPAQAFIELVLIEACGAQHVLAGYDFLFGHNRSGSITDMKAWLQPKQIGVTEIAPCGDEQGVVFSASRARKALQEGDPVAAAHILGRPWAISGMVQHGAKRGTQLGIPTANIALGDYLRPRYGVYAIRARQIGQSVQFAGVANIGKRPTVDGANEWLEAHLFDFTGDIYGQEWEIELIAFLRPEQAFSGLNALRSQIMQDLAAAKAILAEKIALPRA